MHKIYLLAVDAPLHELMGLLDPTEPATLTTLEGTPAIAIEVDRQERYGEITASLHEHPNEALRSVPLAVELDETDVMKA